MKTCKPIVLFIALFCFVSTATLSAQESLKSAGEDYYDFLALQ
jgi:hypothetical protein